MSEIDRLYQYKTLLSSRRVMSREDILHKLEISLATFKRDIAKLRDQLHTPIVFDRDLGGYRLEQTDSTELPGMWFSQDEMLALLTIQSMIVQLEPGLLGPKLKPFQKRLDDMLASQGLDAATLTQRVRAVHAGKRRLTLTSFETVAKATLERKQIQIEHLNRESGQTLLRDISPQQLVHYRDNWYVDAWCHLRGGLRSFSIDAISRANLLDKAAKDIDLISMREQFDGGYGIFGGMPKAWAVLHYLQTQQTSITVNLGTGRGVSVRELADTFARVTGVPVPYRFVDRRPGDVAACYADTTRAREALGWQAQLGVERMCQDAWRWQSQNPKGY
uniref:WYL domain-containing protein n=1 Tax=Limnohabitans sp. TaxID=1907725 RepID=UPI0040471829